MTVFIGQPGQAPREYDSSISYGTHTLPKPFWTSNKPGILKDPEFRQRRAVKAMRTAKNGERRADINRNGSTMQKRG